MVLVDCTNGNMELPSQGGFRGGLYRISVKREGAHPLHPHPGSSPEVPEEAGASSKLARILVNMQAQLKTPEEMQGRLRTFPVGLDWLGSCHSCISPSSAFTHRMHNN